MDSIPVRLRDRVHILPFSAGKLILTDIEFVDVLFLATEFPTHSKISQHRTVLYYSWFHLAVPLSRASRPPNLPRQQQCHRRSSPRSHAQPIPPLLLHHGRAPGKLQLRHHRLHHALHPLPLHLVHGRQAIQRVFQ